MKGRRFIIMAIGFGFCMASHLPAEIPAGYQGTPFMGEPVNGQPLQIPGEIKAVYFDEGGEGVAFHDGTGNNIGGSMRITAGDDAVDMQPFTMDWISDCSPLQNDTWHLSWIQEGEWLRFTVDVRTAGTYVVDLNQAVSSMPNKTSFSFNDGTPFEQVDLPKSTEACGEIYHSWKWDLAVDTVELNAGLQVLRFTFVQGMWNFDALRFSLLGETSSGARSAPSSSSGLSVRLSGETLTLSYHSPAAGAVNIRILDTRGKSLSQTTVQSAGRGQQTASVDAGSLENGVYQILVEQGGSTKTRLMPVHR